MAFKNNAQRLLALLATVTGTNAYKVYFYNSKQCTSQQLHNDVFGPERGCQSLGGMTANSGSMIIESTGPIDGPFMMVLFESNDCNPDTILAYGDENSGCLSAGDGKSFHSYQVWDLWE